MTNNTRVTRKEAALAAGISERTVQRLAAAGRIQVFRSADYRDPALYLLEEVLTAAAQHVRRTGYTSKASENSP